MQERRNHDRINHQQNIQEHRGRIGRVDHGSLRGCLRSVRGHLSDEGSTGSDSSSSSSATARTLDEIKKSGKLKVAVFSDKAPFGYVDKDGNYAGYDVYFAERLGKDLGVDVEYTSVDAAARVDVLTSNKVDITLANFTVTDERKEKVDFAKPYMKVALGVVSRKTPKSPTLTSSRARPRS